MKNQGKSLKEANKTVELSDIKNTKGEVNMSKTGINTIILLEKTQENMDLDELDAMDCYITVRAGKHLAEVDKDTANDLEEFVVNEWGFTPFEKSQLSKTESKKLDTLILAIGELQTVYDEIKMNSSESFKSGYKLLKQCKTVTEAGMDLDEVIDNFVLSAFDYNVYKLLSAIYEPQRELKNSLDDIVNTIRE